MKGKRTIHLGYFDSREAAYSAYCSAAIDLHGDFSNTQCRPLIDSGKAVQS